MGKGGERGAGRSPPPAAPQRGRTRGGGAWSPARQHHPPAPATAQALPRTAPAAAPGGAAASARPQLRSPPWPRRPPSRPSARPAPRTAAGGQRSPARRRRGSSPWRASRAATGILRHLRHRGLARPSRRCSFRVCSAAGPPRPSFVRGGAAAARPWFRGRPTGAAGSRATPVLLCCRRCPDPARSGAAPCQRRTGPPGAARRC
mmetsp:Transcript_75401/g.213146  ORF Transcript_75401/g.213146 Transcript_75401/m.213146 type:complete len:204 (+) Transcript_75401:1414-2025(+)